jgi:molybdopterin molybdotransferase
VFGLPGNPVSSFVTALMLVAPFVAKMQGASNPVPRPLRLRAEFDWLKPDDRREFLRVRRHGDGVQLCGQQGSNMLKGLVEADGLVDNPCGQIIRHGDAVDFLPLEGGSLW